MRDPDRLAPGGLVDGDLTISVNVSGRQFGEPDLVEAVVEALKKHALPGDALRLEITESSVMYKPEHMHAALDELQRVGVRAQIDDFGTGYSSLTFLHHFHGDALKIDRSFISTMQDDAGSEAIVRGVIALGRSLDLDVIAEGVESREQLEHLHGLGCEFAQGFLFSEPMEASAMEELVAEWNSTRVEFVPSSNGDL